MNEQKTAIYKIFKRIRTLSYKFVVKQETKQF